mmetsp:Transcript_88253/g.156466  ORF Transcript_88253/g.156466 Transcript_88253/m.156466 type:complete len:242 (-) Transcript_88253:830-1555(-)
MAFSSEPSSRPPRRRDFVFCRTSSLLFSSAISFRAASSRPSSRLSVMRLFVFCRTSSSFLSGCPPVFLAATSLRSCFPRARAWILIAAFSCSSFLSLATSFRAASSRPSSRLSVMRLFVFCRTSSSLLPFATSCSAASSRPSSKLWMRTPAVFCLADIGLGALAIDFAIKPSTRELRRPSSFCHTRFSSSLPSLVNKAEVSPCVACVLCMPCFALASASATVLDSWATEVRTPSISPSKSC